jgi:hypothetical protein
MLAAFITNVETSTSTVTETSEQFTVTSPAATAVGIITVTPAIITLSTTIVKTRTLTSISRTVKQTTTTSVARCTTIPFTPCEANPPWAHHFPRRHDFSGQLTHRMPGEDVKLAKRSPNVFTGGPLSVTVTPEAVQETVPAGVTITSIDISTVGALATTTV